MVEDDNGCAAYDTIQITVDDIINPTAVCKDITVQLDGTGNVSIVGSDVDGGSTDNCSAPGDLIFSVSQTDFTCANIGINGVILTVFDEKGNSSTCGADVTVQDVTDPTFTFCPTNQTIDSDAGICTYTKLDNGWNATGTDNCSVASLTYNLTGVTSGTGTTLNGVTFNVGVTTVTWTITDGAGLTAQCAYTVTVEDNEDPTINCIANQTVDSDAGICTYTRLDNA